MISQGSDMRISPIGAEIPWGFCYFGRRRGVQILGDGLLTMDGGWIPLTSHRGDQMEVERTAIYKHNTMYSVLVTFTKHGLVLRRE